MITRRNTKYVRIDHPLLQKLITWQCQWQLIVDGRGNKILQNRFTEQYAHIGPVPAAGNQVTGRPDSKDATNWDITPTSYPDRFT